VRMRFHIRNLKNKPGELVLDAFVGSGTTAAVAHKLKRRWIGIEQGEHLLTHCVPRLRKVVSGTDPGGITESSNWRGGGGFAVFDLR
jgi:adenine-specific DNA-methyltransferase